MIIKIRFKLRFSSLVSLFVTILILVVVTPPSHSHYGNLRIEFNSEEDIDIDSHQPQPHIHNHGPYHDHDFHDHSHEHYHDDEYDHAYPHGHPEFHGFSSYEADSGVKMDLMYLGEDETAAREMIDNITGEDNENIMPETTPAPDLETTTEVVFDHNDDSEERNRPHFALDPRKTVKLALIEQKISTKLLVISLFETRDEVPTEDECHYSLKTYLEDYEQDTKALIGATGYIRATNVSSNPFLIYRMIRRIVVNINYLTSVCKENENTSEIVEAVEDTFAGANLTLPNNQDFEDALFGILRIQYVYGFNATSQLRFGILGDLHTNVTLSFYDCLPLAEFAFKQKAWILTYQWLLSAELSMTQLPKDEFDEAASHVDKAWKMLAKVTKIERTKIHEELGKSHEVELESFFSYDRYKACRGESELPEIEKSDLRCFLDNTADYYWTINPLKVELLKFDPPVWQFYDFVSDQTIEYIRKLSLPNLYRSGVVAASMTHTEYSRFRTSLTTWIYDQYIDPDPVMHKLNRRMELVTGLEIAKEHASQALQVVSYGSLGGHYDFHVDSLGSDNPAVDKEAGDRIATFLMFLSDVQMGGYTAFPQMGIFARPEKGSAILWFSLYLNGNPDERTLHGGCPVVFGTKMVANKWIMHHQNFLKYQCSLDPDE